MNIGRPLLFAAVIVPAISILVGVARAAPSDLPSLEEAAFRAAADAVAPSVVSIETVGGLETLGDVLVGTGPSSGLVVSDDGYVISSTFNFAHQPASIVVSLADGRRAAAKLVARDEVRKLVLLKIEVPGKLPVPPAAPQAEIAVGQWSIAVGRTYEFAKPNVSVGIISAVNRIWGKALQTDAKISPVNYGGPLVDIRGRVLGVLVPLSPNEKEDVSGVEWYDSGIGFAVPLEHVLSILPRLKQGETLKPGLVGIRFKGSNIYADSPTIATARAGSPAFKAGLRRGDVIAAVEGRAVALQVQVMEQIQKRYAGDKLRVTVARGPGLKEKLDVELLLVDHLAPYKRPFLGLLAERSIADKAEGVAVRHVFADSPAEAAGIEIGDRITAVGDTAVKNRDALLTAVAESEPGKPIRLTVARSGGSKPVELEPAAVSDAIPESLAPAVKKPADAEANATKVEPLRLKIAEFSNQCDLYVPDNYTDDVAHGVVILLHPEGGFTADRAAAIVGGWLPHCRRDGLLLLVPEAADDDGAWAPTDAEFLGKALDRVAGDYRLDPRRIVVHGVEEGGSIGSRIAALWPERIRAAALVNASFAGAPTEDEPDRPIAFYVATEKDFPLAARVKSGVETLRKRFFPVAERRLTAGAEYLDDEQLAELARWIDSLDRF